MRKSEKRWNKSVFFFQIMIFGLEKRGMINFSKQKYTSTIFNALKSYEHLFRHQFQT